MNQQQYCPVRSLFKNKEIQGVNIAIGNQKGVANKQNGGNDQFFENSLDLKRALRKQSPHNVQRTSEGEQGSQKSFQNMFETKIRRCDSKRLKSTASKYDKGTRSSVAPLLDQTARSSALSSMPREPRYSSF